MKQPYILLKTNANPDFLVASDIITSKRSRKLWKGLVNARKLKGGHWITIG